MILKLKQIKFSKKSIFKILGISTKIKIHLAIEMDFYFGFDNLVLCSPLVDVFHKL